MLDRVHFLSNFLLKIDHKVHYTEESKHVQPVTYSQFCESSMPTKKEVITSINTVRTEASHSVI